MAARRSLTLAEPAETGANVLSVLIPVLGEHATIALVHQDYKAALAGSAPVVEFIYVLDHRAVQAVAALAALKTGGEPLEAIVLSRWDGEAAALRSGFQYARGDTILTLPAQEGRLDPAVLPAVLAALDGCDMVVARRARGGSRIEAAQEALFHGLIRMLFRRTFHDLACRVRVYRRQVLEEIAGYSAQQHFLPLLAAERGFKIREFEIAEGPPTGGGNGRRLGRLKPFARARLALDALALLVGLKFVRRPLRFFGAIGLPILLFGLVLTSVLAIGRLFFEISLADRPMLILGVLLIVLGVEILALGLVGEIIIFASGKRTRDYTIDKIL